MCRDEKSSSHLLVHVARPCGVKPTTSALPRHGDFTETSVYSLSDDHYQRLVAKTIRAENRTSDQIVRSLVGSISDIEIDRSYHGGLTNYHEYAFAKISKLITDMEWRTNFIYLDSTTIQAWTFPKSKKEMQSFLGAALFFHNHIPDYNNWAAPLYKMVHDKFNWDKSTWEFDYVNDGSPFLRLVQVSGKISSHCFLFSLE